MSSSIGRHLRSNLIGYLAVFLALTGITYAAGLPKDSVKSKQIKDGQVQNADLAAGAVDGSKVAANSLGGQQIDESTLGQVPSAQDAARLGGQDAAAFQQRVTGACSSGQSVQSIAADGEVACGAPAAYTAAAGGGLVVSGTAFSLAPCTGGQLLKATGGSSWGCAADDDIPPNPSSGDLSGAYPNPILANGSVSGGNAGEVVDNSITGADVSESTLGNVPSATNADTVDGKHAADLSSARIHATGAQAETSLFSGLSYVVVCQADYMDIEFFLTNPATANMMIVGSGIDPGTTTSGDVNVVNGAQTARTSTVPSTPKNRFFVGASDGSGTAQAEMQIIVESGSTTYTIAVHLFHNAASGACETAGTATIAN